MLKAYGNQMLTHTSNTIVAIVGLAENSGGILQHVEPFPDDNEYIAGISGAEQRRGLLWASADIEGIGPIPRPC